MITEYDWPSWQGGGPGTGQLPTLSVLATMDEALSIVDDLPPLFRFLIPRTVSQASKRLPWFVIVYLLYQAYEWYADSDSFDIVSSSPQAYMWTGPGYVEYA